MAGPNIAQFSTTPITSMLNEAGLGGHTSLPTQHAILEISAEVEPKAYLEL